MCGRCRVHAQTVRCFHWSPTPMLSKPALSWPLPLNLVAPALLFLGLHTPLQGGLLSTSCPCPVMAGRPVLCQAGLAVLMQAHTPNACSHNCLRCYLHIDSTVTSPCAQAIPSSAASAACMGATRPPAPGQHQRAVQSRCAPRRCEAAAGRHSGQRNPRPYSRREQLNFVIIL